jgi:hypothetical protein
MTCDRSRPLKNSASQSPPRLVVAGQSPQSIPHWRITVHRLCNGNQICYRLMLRSCADSDHANQVVNAQTSALARSVSLAMIVRK